MKASLKLKSEMGFTVTKIKRDERKRQFQLDFDFLLSAFEFEICLLLLNPNVHISNILKNAATPSLLCSDKEIS